ncbi:MAG: type II secretion system protein [Firmicutes bacterium]|nr:type II secretion system protein [Bacillota bacterium]
MKQKRGFTLVELLAVISILAAIILVCVPSIINTIKNNEEKEYQDFENTLKRATELYVERNRSLYPELNIVGSSIEVDGETLVNEEYLKPDIKNPNDNSSVTEYKILIEVGNDEIITYTVKGK